MTDAFHLDDDEVTRSDHPVTCISSSSIHTLIVSVSWLFGFEMDHENLRTPFRHTLGMIALGILLAVLLATLLAKLGYAIARAPVLGLTQGLIGFADGEHAQRLAHRRSVEIQAASKAFNRMADAWTAPNANAIKPCRLWCGMRSWHRSGCRRNQS